MLAGDYFYGNVYNDNWKDFCEILCNNALADIDRISSLAKTFNDENVHCYAEATIRQIEALKAFLGGEETC